ncbi:MAG: hypothetical protein HZA31_03705 [Opitutae bacterium]|nr:hypothetical protein [Opitutae bacterium]
MSSTFATTPVAASALNILTVRDAAKHLLAKYAEQPGDAVTWQELLAFRRELAALVAAISARKKESPESTEAIELVHLFAGSGVLDYPVETEDLALVEKYRTGGWPGLLACMLLVPAWQWSGAPRFDDVPTWLWPIYTA